MKKLVVLLSFAVLAGCANGQNRIQNYLDDPVTILEDPVSVDHQTDLDELERSYLRKEISYADYLEKKRRLDDNYTQEVNKRQRIIEDTGTPMY